jgi:hypothetical protein
MLEECLLSLQYFGSWGWCDVYWVLFNVIYLWDWDYCNEPHWCGHGFQMQPHAPHVVKGFRTIHVSSLSAFASSNIHIGGNGSTLSGQGGVNIMQNQPNARSALCTPKKKSNKKWQPITTRWKTLWCMGTLPKWLTFPQMKEVRSLT